MTLGWKIARRIVLISVSVLTAIIVVTIVCTCALKSYFSSYLDFSYNEYRGETKSKIMGSAQTIEISEYNKIDILYSLKNADVFPESIAYGKVKLYLFSDPLFEYSTYPRGEAYLEWETSENIYNEEINRIKSIEGRGYSKKHPVWSENLFLLPSLVATYNCDGVFEYVLFDKETHTIRYVILRDIETIDNIVFNHDYEPKKVIKNSDISMYAKADYMYDIYSY